MNKIPIEICVYIVDDNNGAHDADRTHDLVLTKDVLYQLSYVGTRLYRIMERATRFELATSSLEG